MEKERKKTKEEKRNTKRNIGENFKNKRNTKRNIGENFKNKRNKKRKQGKNKRKKERTNTGKKKKQAMRDPLTPIRNCGGYGYLRNILTVI